MNLSERFINSHNLVNRVYDMLYFFRLFKKYQLPEGGIKNEIRTLLKSDEEVETIAKYLNTRRNKKYVNFETRCNLKNLIHDLDVLKQYLAEELQES